MASLNRDRTRTSSRLEPFLAGSALVHVALAVGLAFLLVPVPAPIPATPVEQVNPEPVTKEPAITPEEERAQQEERAILNELIRPEVAREQLRPLFDRLTANTMAAADIENLWEELLGDFEAPLDGLAELLQEPDFDAAEFTARARKLREQLLPRLEQRVREAVVNARERELTRHAEALAKALAEELRRALEQLGKPIGEALHQAVQTEQRQGQTLLQKAGQELALASRSARQAEVLLLHARQNLERGQRDLEAAQQKNDAKARQQAQSRVKAEQTKLASIQRHLEQGRKQAETAGLRLEDRHPELAGPARSAAKELDTTSKEPVTQAANESAQGKAQTAARAARQAQEKTERTATTLEKLAEAVRLQAAREQIAQARHEANVAAREPNPQKSAEAGKHAEKARAAAHAAETALDPARQKAAASEVKAAREKLQQGQAELTAKNPAAARPHLDAAQARLDAAEAQVRREQAKLGVEPGNATEAVLGQVDEVRRKSVVQAVESKLQPLLEQRVQAEISPHFRGGLAQQPQARPEVLRQATEALKRLDAGKVVAEAAGKHLPQVKEPSADGAGEHARAQARQAEAAALAQLERLLAPTVEASVKNVLGPVTSVPSVAAPGTVELLRRLTRLQDGSQNGATAAERSGLFHLPDGDGGAGLRARIHQGRDSHGRGRLREDGEAYRKMKEFIANRDQVVGDVVVRQVADGPTARPTAEQKLSPAFIGLARALHPMPIKPATGRTVPKPDFKTHGFGGIPFLPDGAITLDGHLADWKDVPVLDLTPVIKGTETRVKFRPAKQLAQIAWCRQGLLLAFDVEDTTGAIEPVTALQQFWMYDCVEIYFDALNTKASQRGEAHTHQYFIFPFGPRNPANVTGFEAFIQGDSARIVPYDARMIRSAARQTTRGWSLEVLLSRELLYQADFVPGRIVGFNLQVDTGSDLYYYWTASQKFRTSLHPNTWGDLQLLGSDSRVTFLDDAGQPGLDGLVPGKTLRVQVEDPDMNLSPEKKDRVGLTLRTGAGETRTLVLEETTPTSGVFQGSCATLLNVGGGPASALPVFEGETLTAEYLDQVRAFGERNEKVSAKLPVATLGVRFGR